MTIQPGRCYSIADLGAAVRDARETAGHSQIQAAERASTEGGARVDRAHVSYAERGSSKHVKALRGLVAAYLRDVDGQPVRLAEEPSYGVEKA